MKILAVGPLPPPNGGATILFELLIKHLKKNEIEHSIINTSPSVTVSQQNVLSKLTSKIFRSLKVSFQILTKVLKHDLVFLNVSKSGFNLYMPFCLVVCKIFSKKLVVRKFGGEFYDLMNSSGSKLKLLTKLINVDLIFFETKREVELYKKLTNRTNVSWFPNCRNYPTAASFEKKHNKPLKLIFIGEVKVEKGIEFIVNSKLDDLDVTVDIYGPIGNDIKGFDLEKNNKVNYCGLLKKEDVTKTLRKYDCLILPTFYPQEGYPGVILEAFSNGLAVITTSWKAIPEIVINYQNGMLLPIKDSEAIRNSIIKLNQSPELLNTLKKNALLSKSDFDTDIVHKRITDEVFSLTKL